MTRWIGAWLGSLLACVPNAGLAQEAKLEAGAKIAALARLSPGPGSPEAMALLRSGLKDAHPSVRAAAARVTHVIGLNSMVPDLREALRAETDADGAHEEAWAIADLDTTTESDAVLASALEKGSLRSAIIRGILAGRGPRGAALWEKLKEGLAEYPGALAHGLEEGLHQDSASVFASLALRDGLDELVIAMLTTRGIEVDVSVVTAGTRSPSSRVRTAAYVALANRGLTPVGDPAPPKPPENLEERVALHLFEASRGTERTHALTEIVAALAADAPSRARIQQRYLSARNQVRGLAPADRETLLRALEVDAREIESARDRRFPAAPAAAAGVKAAATKTLRGHPPDFVRSVLSETGCQGQASAFDGVQVAYRRGGRAAKIDLLSTGVSAKGCGDAARILGVNALADGGHEQAVLILPEKPEFLSCLGTSRRSPDLPAQALSGTRVGGNIKEPVKTKNVSPVYPPSARDARVQGIVILDATIGPTGCVSALQVLRSVAPALDLAAIDAVSGWVYTPTLLNGTPVPVIMTVTVNFRLN
jgi:TonB family protein